MTSSHSPGQHRPLLSYLVLSSTYLALVTAFGTWFHRSGRRLPERPDARDLALMTAATHKLSRLIAKDRVTSGVRAPFTTFQDDAGPGEVEEAARGTGLQRAIGELLICPYCLGMWVATAFACGLLVAPRLTRTVASVFAVLFGSDLLQIAYKRAEEAM